MSCRRFFPGRHDPRPGPYSPAGDCRRGNLLRRQPGFSRTGARPAKTAASPVVATTFTGALTGRLLRRSSSHSVPRPFRLTPPRLRSAYIPCPTTPAVRLLSPDPALVGRATLPFNAVWVSRDQDNFSPDSPVVVLKGRGRGAGSYRLGGFIFARNRLA